MPSSAGAPSHRDCAAALAASLVLSRPGVAEACLLSGWCDAQREEEVWGHTTRAVGRIAAAAAASLRNQQQHQQWQHQPPGHASLPQQEQMAQAAAEARNEAELALNACMAAWRVRVVPSSICNRRGGLTVASACEARERRGAACGGAVQRRRQGGCRSLACCGWVLAAWRWEWVEPTTPSRLRRGGARRADLCAARPVAAGRWRLPLPPCSEGGPRRLLRCFDFSSLPLDGALRLAFAALPVPGEAQQVDRIVNAIAHAYFRQRPGPFADATSAYVMAFSAMLLNTDQHNANVRNKMTLEQFIKNNRKINAGEDLPREYLEGLYHAIASNEISARAAATHAAPVVQGGYCRGRRPTAASAAGDSSAAGVPVAAVGGTVTCLHQRALRPPFARRAHSRRRRRRRLSDDDPCASPRQAPLRAPLSMHPARRAKAALVSAPDARRAERAAAPRPARRPGGQDGRLGGARVWPLGGAIRDSHGRRHEHTQRSSLTRPPSPQLQRGSGAVHRRNRLGRHLVGS